MSVGKYDVLVSLVDDYEASGQPQSATALADGLDDSTATVVAHLDSLCELDLISRVGDGYRPTVTGRELVALDIDPSGILVLDIVED
jgi:predicted transcriptional regulator